MSKYKKDDLGVRMKSYEHASRAMLTKRMPVIIRLDGKAFHTFTKGMKKPFDETLMKSMWGTAKYLCENVQGCKIAYTQSDEISLLLTNYDNITTESWFDNSIQKMVSVSASMATLAFNKSFRENIEDIKNKSFNDIQYKALMKSKLDTAMFDSRVFVLPKEEVNNYFVWRQQDAIRNSVQMQAQSKFSHQELHKKNVLMLKKMLSEIGADWEDLPTSQRHGVCLNRVIRQIEGTDYSRAGWEVDLDIPIFQEQKEYVENFVYL